MPNTYHHSPKQLDTKQEAIYKKARQFSYEVMSGLLNESPERLYNEIDTMYELVTQMRRERVK
jgi:hypothetical protein